jgi:hypothetical protein
MRVATSQLNMLAEVLWYEEVAMFLNTDRLPVCVTMWVSAGCKQ